MYPCPLTQIYFAQELEFTMLICKNNPNNHIKRLTSMSFKKSFKKPFFMLLILFLLVVFSILHLFLFLKVHLRVGAFQRCILYFTYRIQGNIFAKMSAKLDNPKTVPKTY